MYRPTPKSKTKHVSDRSQSTKPYLTILVLYTLLGIVSLIIGGFYLLKRITIFFFLVNESELHNKALSMNKFNSKQ